MSVKTFCDVCGREAAVTKRNLGDVYEGNVTIASVFNGDICSECDTRVNKAASEAIERTIKAIREETK